MGKRPRLEHRPVVQRLIAETVPSNRMSRVVSLTRGLDAAAYAAIQKRKNIRTTEAAVFNEIGVSKQVQLENLSFWTFRFADPTKLMAYVMREDAEVHDAIVALLRRRLVTEAQPLHIVYGADEAWLGNVLLETGRKSLVISFSIRELGKRLLCQSKFWFTVVVLRQKIMKKIRGTCSAIFRLVFDHHFLSPTGGLRNGGCILNVRDQTFVLFGTLSNAICDGDQFRQTWECKSGSAIKACPLCQNVVSKHNVATPGSGLVCLDCSESWKFNLHTVGSLQRDIQRAYSCLADFAARRIGKGHCEEVIRAIGYEPSADGIWSDPRVAGIASPVDALNFDCAHIFVSDGLLVGEMQFFVDESDGSLGDSYRRFAELGWTSSGRNGPPKASHKLQSCLDKGSFGGHTRPSASEILSFMPLLLFWLSELPGCVGVTSLRLCCIALAAFQQAKYDDTIQGAEAVLAFAKCLNRKYSAYLVAATAARGPEDASAKSHWAWHLIVQFVRDFGELYDSYIVERLHTRVKRQCRFIKNTTQFEQTCITRVAIGHAFGAEAGLDSIRLCNNKGDIHPSAAMLVRPLAAIAAGSGCNVGDNIRILQGDVIKHRGAHGIVLQAIELSDMSIQLLVRLCEVKNVGDVCWNILSESADIVAWAPEQVTSATCWCLIEDRTLVLSLP